MVTTWLVARVLPPKAGGIATPIPSTVNKKLDVLTAM